METVTAIQTENKLRHMEGYTRARHKHTPERHRDSTQVVIYVIDKL